MTPIGTIIRISSNESPALRLGSLNNLYKSVDSIGAEYFRFQGRKSMLLSPRSWVESQCKKLKLNTDGHAEPTKHYICHTYNCSHRLLCHYENAICKRGTPMNREKNLSEKESKDLGGVVVKGLTRFTISDDLHVMQVSTMASFSLFSKHGITDWSTIEEITFSVAGKDEVLNLLGCALVSRWPLTEALLKHKPLAESRMLLTEALVKHKPLAELNNENILYQGVPLGYMVRSMHSGSSNVRIQQLYKSVQDLDEECFNSSQCKEMLLSPKLAFGFGCKNDLVGLEEGPQHAWYYRYSAGFGSTSHEEILSTDSSLCYPSYPIFGQVPCTLKVIDPKSQEFITGPKMLVVADNLIVAPISSIFSLSILNQMKVPFTDIEEKVVHVGIDEDVMMNNASNNGHKEILVSPRVAIRNDLLVNWGRGRRAFLTLLYLSSRYEERMLVSVENVGPCLSAEGLCTPNLTTRRGKLANLFAVTNNPIIKLVNILRLPRTL